MDRRKRIVGVEKNIAPWKIAVFPRKAFGYLLELPVGGAKGLREGDALKWTG